MFKQLKKLINNIRYYNSTEIDEACDHLDNKDLEYEYIACWLNTHFRRMKYNFEADDIKRIMQD